MYFENQPGTKIKDLNIFNMFTFYSSFLFTILQGFLDTSCSEVIDQYKISRRSRILIDCFLGTYQQLSL